jgi:fimbrial isopeptide formation D2 family protein
MVPGITQSNTTSFRVIEPSLSIAKSSTPSAGSTVGAGDNVQYSLFITNATGLDASSAHNLVITDTLPLYARTTPPGSVAVTINSLPIVDYATAYDTASGVFTLTLGATVSLNAGETLRVDYHATIDNTVPAATALINQAHVVWSSLAGSITGKRDYGPISATTTLYGPQPTLGKAATPPIVTLGSTVVFTLSVPGTPLGAMLNNVAVTDTPTAVSLKTSANATFSGQIVTATFASIASFAQETIVITATVLNLPTTTNGTSITNVAALNYANNPGGPVLSPIVTLDVHEPNVTLAKSVTTAQSGRRWRSGHVHADPNNGQLACARSHHHRCATE